jgi:hypothetical protein
MRDLRRDGLRVFNAEHDRPQIYKAAGFRQIITPAHIAQWDLSPSAQDRRTAMHPKWRNQLRKAEACNLRIRETARRTRFLPTPMHWHKGGDTSRCRQPFSRYFPASPLTVR